MAALSIGRRGWEDSEAKIEVETPLVLHYFFRGFLQHFLKIADSVVL